MEGSRGIPTVQSKKDQYDKTYSRRRLKTAPYRLEGIYHDDVPPLGSKFDLLPRGGFYPRTAMVQTFGISFTPHEKTQCEALITIVDFQVVHHDHQATGRRPGKRKACDSDVSAVTKTQARNSCTQKYGMGKGLMTLWRLANSEGPSPDIENIRIQSAIPNKKRKPTKITSGKRKAVTRRIQVSCNQNKNSKKEAHAAPCNLAIGESNGTETFNTSFLIDDEELELRESQSHSNSVTCSAHLTSRGRNGCTLCKDLLGSFPPLSVNMRHPLPMRPWDSSHESAKKLFMAFRFLYTHADKVDMPPFTLDELAQAFHDKGSLLLGQIHIALLNLLLMDVESEIGNGFLAITSKNCRLYAFIQSVKQQCIDIKIWSKFLNSLSWPEILREVMLAAGYGSNKRSVLQAGKYTKEQNQILKVGLRPGTLKGHLFNILLEQGSGGMQVSKLVDAFKVIELDTLEPTEELEKVIFSTLSSDITLFEKIAASAFRVRFNPGSEKNDLLDSDSEDSGSVENNFTDSDADDRDGTNGLHLTDGGVHVVCDDFPRKIMRKKSIDYEIDESHSGEAWMLGLMEGNYGDLTIEEKLDLLVALVDLTAAGSSLRMESSSRTQIKEPQSALLHGSGAKIKKSSQNMRQNFFKGPDHRKEFLSQKHSQHMGSKQRKTRVAEEYATNNHRMQSIHLGYDRRYNSYWLFLGPCDTKDPGHRRVYFESSEDGHWEVIDTDKGLDALLSSLDGRGAREAFLLASLEKREASLCKAMTRFSLVQRDNTSCVLENNSGTDFTNGSSSSPLSDVDNSLALTLHTEKGMSAPCSSRVCEVGNNSHKIEIWHRCRAFDAWVWKNFYYNLGSLRHRSRPGLQSLARCERCNDLYFRDEKHCIICHTTFELDFDIEERYIVHVSTCRGSNDDHVLPSHKVLSSELQSLKAAICAIEAVMPEETLAETWARSGRTVWVKRLRRTSSLSELLQVLSGFVGAINEGQLFKCALVLTSHSALDGLVAFFSNVPETISAIALWLVKLDCVVTSYLEQVQRQNPHNNQRTRRGRGDRARIQ